MFTSDIFEKLTKLGSKVYIDKDQVRIEYNGISISAIYEKSSKMIIIAISEEGSTLFSTEVESGNGMSMGYVNKFREILRNKTNDIGIINIIHNLVNDFIVTYKNELKGVQDNLNDLLRIVNLERATGALISCGNVLFDYHKKIDHDVSNKYCELLRAHLKNKLGIEITYIEIDQRRDYSFRIISSLTKDLFSDKLKSKKNNTYTKISK